jgi:uncharacterized OB-fold protein
VSLAVPVCEACGHAVFPPRALCPRCDSSSWETVHVDDGVVEELTERDGVTIASVRLDAGPVIVARGRPPLERGARVRFTGGDPPEVAAT